MSRLPFNFDDRAGEDAGDADAESSGADAMDATAGRGSRGRKREALTVSQLSNLVRSALAESLPPKVRVVGEISNFTNRQHWFFSLKDADAAIRCVCFATAARRVGFPVKDGLEVVATGRIDYYAAQGSLQLYVDKMEPVGVGGLELQLRQLIEQLRGEGYFDPERKQPLPAMPEKVAVVTSRSGAALQDVINTTTRRWPGCRLYLYDVRVQGEAAAPEVAEALRRLSIAGPGLGIDAIILTRGGGSIEDLWAFNERIVADALLACPIPVVAAIGHEVDTTIAELVADVRAATPTQAAMQLIPDRAALVQQIDQLGTRLGLAVKREGQHARQHLEALAKHPALRKPDEVLKPRREQLERLSKALRTAVTQRLATDRKHVDALGKHLRAVGPQSVLERGFSFTQLADGRVVRSKAEVAAGDRVTTTVADGKFDSEVLGTGDAKPMEIEAKLRESKSPPPRQAKKKRGKSKRSPKRDGDADQPSLF